MAEARRTWLVATIAAAIVAIVVIVIAASGGDGASGPDEAGVETDAELETGSRTQSDGVPTGGSGDGEEAEPGSGIAASRAATERVVARGGDAGISPGRGPTPGVAVELGHSPGSATSGARLGQARYLLDQQRERLPRIEQAILEAERAGDAERLRIERERLAIARSRIAELEAHATDLETAAREDGTLADAEREGPRPIGVGNRPEGGGGSP